MHVYIINLRLSYLLSPILEPINTTMKSSSLSKFQKEPLPDPSFALSACERAAPTGKTATPTTHPQVVHYLLQTYVTDKTIGDPEKEISTYIQLPDVTPLQYSVELVDKTHFFGDV